MDEDQRVSLVFVHDKPEDGSGGEIGFKMDSPALRGMGVQMLMKDDPSHKWDKYAWDSNTGIGEFSWKWVRLCFIGSEFSLNSCRLTNVFGHSPPLSLPPLSLSLSPLVSHMLPVSSPTLPPLSLPSLPPISLSLLPPGFMLHRRSHSGLPPRY